MTITEGRGTHKAKGIEAIVTVLDRSNLNSLKISAACSHRDKHDRLIDCHAPLDENCHICNEKRQNSKSNARRK